MTRKEGKVNFQLSVTPEEKAMIKKSAKEYGMRTNDYVVMVCKLANGMYGRNYHPDCKKE